MQELTGTMARADKQTWWSMLQWYVKVQGWSSGRAANVYREKFGVWPRGLSDVPMTPNNDVAKFVDDGIKRYIKSIKEDAVMEFISFCQAHGILIDHVPPIGVWKISYGRSP
jgi:hypothetical protein